MLSNESLRVGYVLKRYPRFSETFIVNEILAHEAAGLEIEIWALRPPTDTHFQDIVARVRAPVHYLRSYGVKVADFWSTLQEAAGSLPGFWPTLDVARGEEGRDVYQAVLLAQEARRRGISHLHAHFATAATTVTRLAAHFGGLPYTFTAHAKDIFHDGVAPQDLQRKLRDAKSVVTVSDYNVRYLRQRYGDSAVRVRRIYNGLDLERFPYRVPDRRRPRVVGVGRLVEKKGFAYLVEACAILARRGCSFECQIIGAGELEDELRSQIARVGLHERIRLTGPRPQSEIIRHIQEAAVLAAPCVIGSDGNRDGLPTVLLEAMALGTPCVSTDVTGIPEVLHDGETGLMVPQRDPIALAAALERLLRDSELRVRLASLARRQIEADFDIHSNAASLRALFVASQALRRVPGPESTLRNVAGELVPG
ncbi:MAG: glycosyltransferase family 4 protein [Ardenticatenaceae bacterium]